MKKTYIAPASVEYAMQQQAMLATSLGVKEQSAEQWSNRQNGWHSEIWNSQDKGNNWP